MKDVHDLEVYACIDGFPNYLVTSYGRILSIKGKQIKEMKQCNNKGYMYICLCKNNNKKSFRVHRLVAQTFIPNPYNKSEVNHKDENPSNNSISNLEWCTHIENINYGNRTNKARISNSDGRRKGKNHYNFGKHLSSKTKIKIAKTKFKKVMGKSLTEPKVLVFKSVVSAEKCGFNPRNISNCCNGRRKSHKGYSWHYIDNNKKDHQ